MNKKYELAIFDLDGTVLDTKEGLLSAIKYTIREMGYEMLSDSVLSTFIGPPVQDSFAREYGLEGPVLQEIATVFRNQYSTVDLLKAAPYEGIYDLFQGLKVRRVQSAIATYKREDYAVKLLKYYGFDRYTEIMYGGDHENRLKKKDIIEKCIRDSGVTDKSKIVMIGDTIHDALGAELVGVDFIGVTYGFGFRTIEDVMEQKAVGCAATALGILEFF